MKKVAVLVSLILSMLFANAQTIINLSYDKENGFEPFSFVNPKDSIFLEFKHREDMGARYNFNYQIKNNIPDGEYKIVVNEILREHFLIKNLKWSGIRKVYYETGELYYSESFDEGVKNGDYKVFYRNGKLRAFAKYFAGDPYLIKELNESGKVSCRRYYLPENSSCIRVETYDKNGRILRIQNSNESDSILYSQEFFSDGKLNDVTTLEYKKGVFTLEFKENSLLKAQFKSYGKVITIVTTDTKQ